MGYLTHLSEPEKDGNPNFNKVYLSHDYSSKKFYWNYDPLLNRTNDIIIDKDTVNSNEYILYNYGNTCS